MRRKTRPPKLDPAQLDLAVLAAAPLADPGKIYLPAGRKRSGTSRTPAELELFREERAAKIARLERDALRHRAELLDYYAKSSVEPAVVARYTGLALETVYRELRERGRQC